MTGSDQSQQVPLQQGQLQQQCTQCGLSKLKHFFVIVLITSFISILFMRAHVKSPAAINVHESKDDMLVMNQRELWKLAQGYVEDDSDVTKPKTGNGVVVTASLSTTESEKTTMHDAKLTTPYVTGTVSHINPNLSATYLFIYGNKSQQQPIKSREACSLIPPGLVGEIKVFQEHYPLNELNSVDFRLTAGGSYTPPTCVPQQKLAIIIPFRNRDKHLSILLLNLHPLLQKQQLEYTVFVINQVEGSKFNRAILMNVGFLEALKHGSYNCFIFHDVDLLPQNDKNLYTCPDDNPRHMSAYIDKYDYRLPYVDILGGIVAISSKLFVKVNGYSNLFFGWGGEDDDFSGRCRRKGLKITRYPKSVARYQMIRHKKDKGNEDNPQRFEMLKHTGERQQTDGLNSIVYGIQSTELLPMYTRINVIINQRDVMNAGVHTLPDYILRFA